MLEITIHIEASELATAINNLAASLQSSTVNNFFAGATASTPTDTANTTVQAANVTSITAAPDESQPVTATVPVAAPPQYTTEQIMEAGATLMDAGKINDLMALLQKFGVQAVMDLKPEQLGPFATAMRELGAKI